MWQTVQRLALYWYGIGKLVKDWRIGHGLENWSRIDGGMPDFLKIGMGSAD